MEYNAFTGLLDYPSGYSSSAIDALTGSLARSVSCPHKMADSFVQDLDLAFDEDFMQPFEPISAYRPTVVQSLQEDRCRSQLGRSRQPLYQSEMCLLTRATDATAARSDSESCRQDGRSEHQQLEQEPQSQQQQQQQQRQDVQTWASVALRRRKQSDQADAQRPQSLPHNNNNCNNHSSNHNYSYQDDTSQQRRQQLLQTTWRQVTARSTPRPQRLAVGETDSCGSCGSCASSGGSGSRRQTAALFDAFRRNRGRHHRHREGSRRSRCRDAASLAALSCSNLPDLSFLRAELPLPAAVETEPRQRRRRPAATSKAAAARFCGSVPEGLNSSARRGPKKSVSFQFDECHSASSSIGGGRYSYGEAIQVIPRRVGLYGYADADEGVSPPLEFCGSPVGAGPASAGAALYRPAGSASRLPVPETPQRRLARMTADAIAAAERLLLLLATSEAAAAAGALGRALQALLRLDLLPSVWVSAADRRPRQQRQAGPQSSLWLLVEESCKAGPLGANSGKMAEVMRQVRSISGLTTETEKFGAFVTACLNTGQLSSWLAQLAHNAPLLKRHYLPAAFLRRLASGGGKTAPPPPAALSDATEAFARLSTALRRLCDGILRRSRRQPVLLLPQAVRRAAAATRQPPLKQPPLKAAAAPAAKAAAVVSAGGPPPPSRLPRPRFGPTLMTVGADNK